MLKAEHKVELNKYSVKVGLDSFNLIISLAFFSLTLFVILLISWGEQAKLFLGADYLTFVVILSVFLLAFSLGGYYWGRQIEGESSLAPQLLLCLAVLTLIFVLLAPKVFIFFLNRGIFFSLNWLPDFFVLYLENLFIILISFFPTIFCLGGICFLLLEIFLDRSQNLEKGLVWINSTSLLGGFGGALIVLFLFNYGFFILHIIAATLSVLVLLLAFKLDKQSSQNRNFMAIWKIILIPKTSWGKWSGQTSYGARSSIAPAAVKLSSVSLCLVGFSLAGFCFLGSNLFSLSDVYPLKLDIFSWLLIFFALFIGSISTKLVTEIFGLVLSLALSFFLLVFLLFIFFHYLNKELTDFIFFFWQKNLALFFIFFFIGLIISVSGQIIQSKRLWLASSFGLSFLYLSTGFFAGIFLVSLIGNYFESLKNYSHFFLFLMILAAILTINGILKISFRGLVLVPFIILVAFCLYLMPSSLSYVNKNSLKGPDFSENDLKKFKLILLAYQDKQGDLKKDAPKKTLLINPKQSFLTLNLGLDILNPLEAKKEMTNNEDLFTLKQMYFARFSLAKFKEQYDLIILNQFSSDAWPEQTSGFFTQLKKKLGEKGIVAQVIARNSFTADYFQSLIKSWQQVFPQSNLWELNENYILLIAFKDDTELKIVGTDWWNPTAAVLAKEVGYEKLYDFRLLFFLGEEMLEEVLFSEALVFTDNKPAIKVNKFYSSANNTNN